MLWEKHQVSIWLMQSIMSNALHQEYSQLSELTGTLPTPLYLCAYIYIYPGPKPFPFSLLIVIWLFYQPPSPSCPLLCLSDFLKFFRRTTEDTLCVLLFRLGEYFIHDRVKPLMLNILITVSSNHIRQQNAY